MPVSSDVKETYERFQAHIEEFQRILRKYQIPSRGLRRYPAFAKLVSTNHELRNEVVAQLRVVAALDGGKLSLATLGTVLGLAIGGIGVAATGTAIGVPAAAVTLLATIAGGLVGQELDSTGKTSSALTLMGIPPTSVGDDERRKSLPPSVSDPIQTSDHRSSGDGGRSGGEIQIEADLPRHQDPSLYELAERIQRIEDSLVEAARQRELNATEADARWSRIVDRITATESVAKMVADRVNVQHPQIASICTQLVGVQKKVIDISEKMTEIWELVERVHGLEIALRRRQTYIAIGSFIGLVVILLCLFLGAHKLVA